MTIQAITKDLLDEYLLFEQHSIRASLIPGSLFNLIAEQVGTGRQEAYAQLSNHESKQRDLDGRDVDYCHILVSEANRSEILGGLRVRFSKGSQSPWSADTSYLEYSYPSFHKRLTANNCNYLEIGRVFVSINARHDFRILPTLMRSAGILARETGHRYLFGLMSFRDLNPDSNGDHIFALEMQGQAQQQELPIPIPRHPYSPDKQLAKAWYYYKSTIQNEEKFNSIDKLCTVINAFLGVSKEPNQSFRIPGFIRVYQKLTQAKPVGLSIARGYNQIAEVLMFNNIASNSKGAQHDGLRISIDASPIAACYTELGAHS
jgi:hypothetical protein